MGHLLFDGGNLKYSKAFRFHGKVGVFWLISPYV
jgi:hypothetical protein